jgi:sugar phosphate permease
MPEYSKSRFEMVRWSIFAILGLSYILVFFHRMAPAAITDELMSAFGASGTGLGVLSAVYFFVYAAMQIPAGVMTDTLGPRFTVSIGNLTAGAGALLFGMAWNFHAAYMGRFLVGLGVSVIFISFLKNNAVWFSPRNFAFMTGLAAFIGNLGSITAAGPFTELLSFFSWREVFYGIGAISIILGLMSFVFIRNCPENAGFPSVREMESGEQPAPSIPFRISDLLAVLRGKGIWPIFWMYSGVTGGLYAVTGLWGIPYLRDVFGLTKTEAAGYLTLTLIAVAVGGVFFGWLSDTLRRRKPVLLGGTIFYLCVWAAFLYLPWGPGLSGYILFFILGFSSMGCIVGYASAKEHTNPAFSGTATSVVNTGMFVAAVLLQPLLGWVLDRTWDGTMAHGVRVYSAAGYHTAFLVLFGGAFLSVIAASMVEETRGENVWELKAALETQTTGTKI